MNNNLKWIFNAEQVEAKCTEARKSNPNAKKIEEIKKQMKKLADEIYGLLSEDEKYLNILNWLANTEEKAAATSLMSNHELCIHLIHIFDEHIEGGMSAAIFDEVLKRLGYEYKDIEEKVSKNNL